MAEPPFVATRGAVNFFLYTAFDFSELTQGGVLGLDFNFYSGRYIVFGATTGIGVLGNLSTAVENKLFLFFPTALRLAVRAGSIVEFEFRAGGAPSAIWRFDRYDGSRFLMKALVGLGLHFNIGRGGGFLCFDLLPNDGVSHVISIGARF